MIMKRQKHDCGTVEDLAAQLERKFGDSSAEAIDMFLELDPQSRKAVLDRAFGEPPQETRFTRRPRS